MFKRLLLTISMIGLAIPSAFATDMLEVNLGYSQVIGPVAEMSTVIIGDDGVADATLGGGGTIILTGKRLGSTNLIVLDVAGRELFASSLQVVPLDRRPTTNVQISRSATNAQTYVCGPTPGCSAVSKAVPPSTPTVVTEEGTTADPSPTSEPTS